MLRLHRRSRRYFSARTALPYPLWAVHFSDRLAFGPVGLFLRLLPSLDRPGAPKPRLSSIVCLTAQSCRLGRNKEGPVSDETSLRSRRDALKCMAYRGAGSVLVLAGGVFAPSWTARLTP